MKLNLNLIGIILLLNSFLASATNLPANFKLGLDLLMKHYAYSSGLWIDSTCIKANSCSGNQGLWYWGNAVHLLADYYTLTGDKVYFAKEFYHTYQQNHNLVLGKNYFDDEGWWSLAFIAAYQSSKKIAYLHSAEVLVADMNKQGAQSVCYGKGGIYWDRQKTQVGSIANELFLTANAKLYLITHQNKYKLQANATWNWFKHSGLLNGNYTINDDYLINNGKCGKKITWQFTYTNGVILSGLTDLAKINNDKTLTEIAKNIANQAMYNFSMGGVLTERCTNVNACAEDAFLFKGIFAYNLAYLAKNANDKEFYHKVKVYLSNNYSQLLLNQGTDGFYGFNWSLPLDMNSNSPFYNPADIVTQISALYLIDANLLLAN